MLKNFTVVVETRRTLKIGSRMVAPNEIFLLCPTSSGLGGLTNGEMNRGGERKAG